MTDETSATARFAGGVRQAWDGGGIVDIEIEAVHAVASWSIDVDLGGEITNIWNARILARQGDIYRLGPLDYNVHIPAGLSVEFGVQVMGSAHFMPLGMAVEAGPSAPAATIEPAPSLPAGTEVAQAPADTTTVPTVPTVPPPVAAPQADPLATVPPPRADAPTVPAPQAASPQVAVPQVGAPQVAAPQVAPPPAAPQTAPTVPEPPTEPLVADGEPLGPGALRLTAQSLRYYDAPGTADISLLVEDETVMRPAAPPGGMPPLDDFAPGPFSTSGGAIIDSAGNVADIHGINWFGLETDVFAPHGLWTRNWREVMDEMKSLGFNTLRVPFSGDLVASNGGKPNGIDYALNPDLEGLNGLEILDAVVAYADRIGLRILLDYHRGKPGSGPNDNGLWYGEGRTEADVIAEWQVVAERYKDAPAVIGADLMNEPHAATWGDGSATDWAAAAERIGNAVLAIAPDWLIVVEGVSVYDGDTYWWGGNLQGVRDRPVRLSESDKVVYSPHDYPASVHAQDWFFDGSDLTEKFRQNWGYIAEDGIAPVLLGEWGSRLETPIDRAWALDLARYLSEHDMPWFWWSLNPNSGDTGGIYEDDWTTVRTDVTGLLEPFLSETRPDLPLADEGLDTGASAEFSVRLDMPADEDLTVKYATTDGTAYAGEDYVATAGELVFAPGEQIKSVRVPILPDAEAVGDEFFYFVLGGTGANDASATARIEETGTVAPGLPFVDVASVVVSEGAATARFRVMLSEAALRDVTIGFSAVRDAAPNEPTRGSFVIPQGAREAAIEVTVDTDAATSEPARYTLTLTAADGATVRTAEAIALVAADPPAAAEFVMTGGNGGAEPRLTLDFIVTDDWGTGATVNVTLKNVSKEPVAAWQLGVDLPFELVELWSAALVSDVGDRVTVRNIEWNGAIAPGESVDFGFIADAGGLDVEAIAGAAGLELLVE